MFCGPSTVFTNVYNPRSAVSRKDEYRTTVVEQGATLKRIARLFAARCRTMSSWCWCCGESDEALALMVGVPAKHIGWMSAYGERVDSASGSRLTRPHTGDFYQLSGQFTVNPLE